MKGCRPLSTREIPAVLGQFRGRWRNRDRALCILGLNSGFRISELLAFRLGTVFSRGHLLGRVEVARRDMKGKHSSRSVVFNSAARGAVAVWVRDLFNMGVVDPAAPLFLSQAQGEDGRHRPITRRQALRIIQRAGRAQGLDGRIGTHSLRKTFARAVYEREKPLFAADPSRELPIRVAMKALGHSSVGVTESYLGLDSAQVDEAVNELNLGGGLLDYAADA